MKGSSLTVTTGDFHQIDWADVAARARADLGDEWIAQASERVRTTMLILTSSVQPGDREGFRPKNIPPMRGDLALD